MARWNSAPRPAIAWRERERWRPWAAAPRSARRYAARWPRIRKAQGRSPQGSAPDRKAEARDSPACPDPLVREDASCKADRPPPAPSARADHGPGPAQTLEPI